MSFLITIAIPTIIEQIASALLQLAPAKEQIPKTIMTKYIF